MIVLDEANEAFDPDAKENISRHFCVLDFSAKDDPDYVWRPISFMDSHLGGAILFETEAGDEVHVPFEWSLVVTSEDEAELLTMRQMVDDWITEVRAFVFNPLSWTSPAQIVMRMVGAQKNYRWSMPAIERTDLLVVPIHRKKAGSTSTRIRTGPACLLLGGERSKISGNLDPAILW